jgi:hypothetical protein
MKKLYSLIAIFSILAFLSGCYEEGIRPAGETTVIDYEFSDFSAVSISNAFNVDIINDEVDPHVSIQIDVNLTPYLEVYVHNDRLYIGLEDGVYARGNAVQRGTIYFNGAIDDFKASGASHVIIKDSITIDDLDIELSGASQLSSDVDVTSLDIEISGASTIQLAGYARYYSMDVSGASSVRGYELSAENIDIDLSGASSCMITAIESLSVEASGASTVRYKGEPVILRSELSGASNLIHVD